MSSDDPVTIQGLSDMFEDAVSDDDVGQEAADIMVSGLNDTNIAGCTGIDADDIDSDCVTIVQLVLDASYSMKHNEDAVREAYDELLIKGMRESKQAKDMIVSARTFEEKQNILYGFKKVTDIGKIGSQYVAEGYGTALYEAAIDAMTGVRAYAKTLYDVGIQTRCVVVVCTDGRNNCGRVMNAADVKTVADDCIKTEMFYLAYVHFKEDPSDNPEAWAKEIGFPSVLTASSNPHDVRQALGMVSQSIVRASQTSIGPANSFFQ